MAIRRPRLEVIQDAYAKLFHSGLSLTKAKDAVLGGRLFSTFNDATGMAGRSMAWKLFLTPQQLLVQSPSDSGSTPPLESLRTSRKEYVAALVDKMRAPDGSYPEGFTAPGLSAAPKRPQMSGNLEKNNPLSLHNENPWTNWFASVELRKTVRQDVERTFPEIGYFRDTDVQTQLTNILFLYSTFHPDIGYRQGMHELLASLYYAVDYDSFPDADSTLSESPEIREFLSRTWVAADAWALFVVIMNGVGPWYEWRDTVRTTPITSSIPRHVELDVPNGRLDNKPYVTPIVQACERIQSKLLRNVDPSLWQSMHSAGIEPQIYGIRWLRLLFTREFSMDDAMVLWDGLFACDPSFELAQWICVAMLLRIRNRLMPSDYSTQLTYLLHYPALPSPAFPDFHSPKHHTMLLLRQALALQMSPSPSTGASIVIENRNLLGIPLEVPDAPPSPTHKAAGNRSREKSLSEGRSRDLTGSGSKQARHGSSEQTLGLPEVITRGLLDKGESLGINKAFMSAVSDLKKNLPELASSLSRTPSTLSATYAVPLADDGPPNERPPWEPRTRFEMEKEIAEMRLTNRRLGESVGWIVDTLLQDEGDTEDQEHVKNIQNRKREALECLSYVRDVLNGNVAEVEEDRLVGEDEMKTRKSKKRPYQFAGGPFTKPVGVHTQIDIPKPAAPTVPSAVERSRTTATSRLDFARNSGRPSVSPESSEYTPTRLADPLQPPLLSLPTASANSAQVTVAPWNYTRSHFSASSPPLTTSLPRPPPPTSTAFHPYRVPSPQRVPPHTQSATMDPSPPKGSQDPLGVLP